MSPFLAPRHSNSQWDFKIKIWSTQIWSKFTYFQKEGDIGLLIILSSRVCQGEGAGCLKSAQTGCQGRKWDSHRRWRENGFGHVTDVTDVFMSQITFNIPTILSIGARYFNDFNNCWIFQRFLNDFHKYWKNVCLHSLSVYCLVASLNYWANKVVSLAECKFSRLICQQFEAKSKTKFKCHMMGNKIDILQIVVLICLQRLPDKWLDVFSRDKKARSRLVH